jgi:hypothetical protein
VGTREGGEKMSDKERYEIAKAFVDKQLKTMEENGLRITKISAHEYDAMVKQIAQTVTASAVSKKVRVSAASSA